MEFEFSQTGLYTPLSGLHPLPLQPTISDFINNTPTYQKYRASVPTPSFYSHNHTARSVLSQPTYSLYNNTTNSSYEEISIIDQVIYIFNHGNLLRSYSPVPQSASNGLGPIKSAFWAHFDVSTTSVRALAVETTHQINTPFLTSQKSQLHEELEIVTYGNDSTLPNSARSAPQSTIKTQTLLTPQPSATFFTRCLCVVFQRLIFIYDTIDKYVINTPFDISHAWPLPRGILLQPIIPDELKKKEFFDFNTHDPTITSIFGTPSQLHHYMDTSFDYSTNGPHNGPNANKVLKGLDLLDFALNPSSFAQNPQQQVLDLYDRYQQRQQEIDEEILQEQEKQSQQQHQLRIKDQTSVYPPPLPAIATSGQPTESAINLSKFNSSFVSKISFPALLNSTIISYHGLFGDDDDDDDDDYDNTSFLSQFHGTTDSNNQPYVPSLIHLNMTTIQPIQEEEEEDDVEIICKSSVTPQKSHYNDESKLLQPRLSPLPEPTVPYDHHHELSPPQPTIHTQDQFNQSSRFTQPLDTEFSTATDEMDLVATSYGQLSTEINSSLFQHEHISDPLFFTLLSIDEARPVAIPMSMIDQYTLPSIEPDFINSTSPSLLAQFESIPRQIPSPIIPINTSSPYPQSLFSTHDFASDPYHVIIHVGQEYPLIVTYHTISRRHCLYSLQHPKNIIIDGEEIPNNHENDDDDDDEYETHPKPVLDISVAPEMMFELLWVQPIPSFQSKSVIISIAPNNIDNTTFSLLSTTHFKQHVQEIKNNMPTSNSNDIPDSYDSNNPNNGETNPKFAAFINKSSLNDKFKFKNPLLTPFEHHHLLLPSTHSTATKLQQYDMDDVCTDAIDPFRIGTPIDDAIYNNNNNHFSASSASFKPTPTSSPEQLSPLEIMTLFKQHSGFVLSLFYEEDHVVEFYRINDSSSASLSPLPPLDHFSTIHNPQTLHLTSLQSQIESNDALNASNTTSTTTDDFNSPSTYTISPTNPTSFSPALTYASTQHSYIFSDSNSFVYDNTTIDIPTFIEHQHQQHLLLQYALIYFFQLSKKCYGLYHIPGYLEQCSVDNKQWTILLQQLLNLSGLHFNYVEIKPYIDIICNSTSATYINCVKSQVNDTESVQALFDSFDFTQGQNPLSYLPSLFLSIQQASYQHSNSMSDADTATTLSEFQINTLLSSPSLQQQLVNYFHVISIQNYIKYILFYYLNTMHCYSIQNNKDNGCHKEKINPEENNQSNSKKKLHPQQFDTPIPIPTYYSYLKPTPLHYTSPFISMISQYFNIFNVDSAHCIGSTAYRYHVPFLFTSFKFHSQLFPTPSPSFVEYFLQRSRQLLCLISFSLTTLSLSATAYLYNHMPANQLTGITITPLSALIAKSIHSYNIENYLPHITQNQDAFSLSPLLSTLVRNVSTCLLIFKSNQLLLHLGPYTISKHLPPLYTSSQDMSPLDPSIITSNTTREDFDHLLTPFTPRILIKSVFFVSKSGHILLSLYNAVLKTTEQTIVTLPQPNHVTTLYLQPLLHCFPFLFSLRLFFAVYTIAQLFTIGALTTNHNLHSSSSSLHKNNPNHDIRDEIHQNHQSYHTTSQTDPISHIKHKNKRLIQHAYTPLLTTSTTATNIHISNIETNTIVLVSQHTQNHSIVLSHYPSFQITPQQHAQSFFAAILFILCYYPHISHIYNTDITTLVTIYHQQQSILNSNTVPKETISTSSTSQWEQFLSSNLHAQFATLFPTLDKSLTVLTPGGDFSTPNQHQRSKSLSPLIAIAYHLVNQALTGSSPLRKPSATTSFPSHTPSSLTISQHSHQHTLYQHHLLHYAETLSIPRSTLSMLLPTISCQSLFHFVSPLLHSCLSFLITDASLDTRDIQTARAYSQIQTTLATAFPIIPPHSIPISHLSSLLFQVFQPPSITTLSQASSDIITTFNSLYTTHISTLHGHLLFTFFTNSIKQTTISPLDALIYQVYKQYDSVVSKYGTQQCLISPLSSSLTSPSSSSTLPLYTNNISSLPEVDIEAMYPLLQFYPLWSPYCTTSKAILALTDISTKTLWPISGSILSTVNDLIANFTSKLKFHITTPLSSPTHAPRPHTSAPAAPLQGEIDGMNDDGGKKLSKAALVHTIIDDVLSNLNETFHHPHLYLTTLNTPTLSHFEPFDNSNNADSSIDPTFPLDHFFNHNRVLGTPSLSVIKQGRNLNSTLDPSLTNPSVLHTNLNLLNNATNPTDPHSSFRSRLSTHTPTIYHHNLQHTTPLAPQVTSVALSAFAPVSFAIQNSSSHNHIQHQASHFVSPVFKNGNNNNEKPSPEHDLPLNNAIDLFHPNQEQEQELQSQRHPSFSFFSPRTTKNLNSTPKNPSLGSAEPTTRPPISHFTATTVKPTNRNRNVTNNKRVSFMMGADTTSGSDEDEMDIFLTKSHQNFLKSDHNNEDKPSITTPTFINNTTSHGFVSPNVKSSSNLNANLNRPPQDQFNLQRRRRTRGSLDKVTDPAQSSFLLPSTLQQHHMSFLRSPFIARSRQTSHHAQQHGPNGLLDTNKKPLELDDSFNSLISTAPSMVHPSSTHFNATLRSIMPSVAHSVVTTTNNIINSTFSLQHQLYENTLNRNAMTAQSRLQNTAPLKPTSLVPARHFLQQQRQINQMKQMKHNFPNTSFSPGLNPNSTHIFSPSLYNNEANLQNSYTPSLAHTNYSYAASAQFQFPVSSTVNPNAQSIFTSHPFPATSSVPYIYSPIPNSLTSHLVFAILIQYDIDIETLLSLPLWATLPSIHALLLCLQSTHLLHDIELPVTISPQIISHLSSLIGQQNPFESLLSHTSSLSTATPTSLSTSQSSKLPLKSLLLLGKDETVATFYSQLFMNHDLVTLHHQAHHHTKQTSSSKSSTIHSLDEAEWIQSILNSIQNIQLYVDSQAIKLTQDILDTKMAQFFDFSTSADNGDGVSSSSKPQEFQESLQRTKSKAKAKRGSLINFHQPPPSRSYIKASLHTPMIRSGAGTVNGNENNVVGNLENGEKEEKIHPHPYTPSLTTASTSETWANPYKSLHSHSTQSIIDVQVMQQSKQYQIDLGLFFGVKNQHNNHASVINTFFKTTIHDDWNVIDGFLFPHHNSSLIDLAKLFSMQQLPSSFSSFLPLDSTSSTFLPPDLASFNSVSSFDEVNELKNTKIQQTTHPPNFIDVPPLTPTLAFPHSNPHPSPPLQTHPLDPSLHNFTFVSHSRTHPHVLPHILPTFTPSNWVFNEWTNSHHYTPIFSTSFGLLLHSLSRSSQFKPLSITTQQLILSDSLQSQYPHPYSHIHSTSSPTSKMLHPTSPSTSLLLPSAPVQSSSPLFEPQFFFLVTNYIPTTYSTISSDDINASTSHNGQPTQAQELASNDYTAQIPKISSWFFPSDFRLTEITKLLTSSRPTSLHLSHHKLKMISTRQRAEERELMHCIAERRACLAEKQLALWAGRSMYILSTRSSQETMASVNIATEITLIQKICPDLNFESIVRKEGNFDINMGQWYKTVPGYHKQCQFNIISHLLSLPISTTQLSSTRKLSYVTTLMAAIVAYRNGAPFVAFRRACDVGVNLSVWLETHPIFIYWKHFQYYLSQSLPGHPHYPHQNVDIPTTTSFTPLTPLSRFLFQFASPSDVHQYLLGRLESNLISILSSSSASQTSSIHASPLPTSTTPDILINPSWIKRNIDSSPDDLPSHHGLVISLGLLGYSVSSNLEYIHRQMVSHSQNSEGGLSIEKTLGTYNSQEEAKATALLALACVSRGAAKKQINDVCDDILFSDITNNMHAINLQRTRGGLINGSNNHQNIDDLGYRMHLLAQNDTYPQQSYLSIGEERLSHISNDRNLSHSAALLTLGLNNMASPLPYLNQLFLEFMTLFNASTTIRIASGIGLGLTHLSRGLYGFHDPKQCILITKSLFSILYGKLTPSGGQSYIQLNGGKKGGDNANDPLMQQFHRNLHNNVPNQLSFSSSNLGYNSTQKKQNQLASDLTHEIPVDWYICEGTKFSATIALFMMFMQTDTTFVGNGLWNSMNCLDITPAVKNDTSGGDPNKPSLPIDHIPHSIPSASSISTTSSLASLTTPALNKLPNPLHRSSFASHISTYAHPSHPPPTTTQTPHLSHAYHNTQQRSHNNRRQTTFNQSVHNPSTLALTIASPTIINSFVSSSTHHSHHNHPNQSGSSPKLNHTILQHDKGRSQFNTTSVSSTATTAETPNNNSSDIFNLHNHEPCLDHPQSLNLSSISSVQSDSSETTTSNNTFSNRSHHHASLNLPQTASHRIITQSVYRNDISLQQLELQRPMINGMLVFARGMIMWDEMVTAFSSSIHQQLLPYLQTLSSAVQNAISLRFSQNHAKVASNSSKLVSNSQHQNTTSPSSEPFLSQPLQRTSEQTLISSSSAHTGTTAHTFEEQSNHSSHTLSFILDAWLQQQLPTCIRQTCPIFISYTQHYIYKEQDKYRAAKISRVSRLKTRRQGHFPANLATKRTRSGFDNDSTQDNHTTHDSPHWDMPASSTLLASITRDANNTAFTSHNQAPAMRTIDDNEDAFSSDDDQDDYYARFPSDSHNQPRILPVHQTNHDDNHYNEHNELHTGLEVESMHPIEDTGSLELTSTSWNIGLYYDHISSHSYGQLLQRQYSSDSAFSLNCAFILPHDTTVTNFNTKEDPSQQHQSQQQSQYGLFATHPFNISSSTCDSSTDPNGAFNEFDQTYADASNNPTSRQSFTSSHSHLPTTFTGLFTGSMQWSDFSGPSGQTLSKGLSGFDSTTNPVFSPSLTSSSLPPIVSSNNASQQWNNLCRQPQRLTPTERQSYNNAIAIMNETKTQFMDYLHPMCHNYLSIIAHGCLAIGLRFAGSLDLRVRDLLIHYLTAFHAITLFKNGIQDDETKNFLSFQNQSVYHSLLFPSTGLPPHVLRQHFSMSATTAQYVPNTAHSTSTTWNSSTTTPTPTLTSSPIDSNTDTTAIFPHIHVYSSPRPIPSFFYTDPLYNQYQSITNQYSQSILNILFRDIDDQTLIVTTGIIAVALGLVMCGSGDLEALKVLRRVRKNTDNNIPYAQHQQLSQAIGLLSLGGCALSIESTSPSNIAMLFCTIFPRYTHHISQHSDYLHFLRFFHVLATNPRTLTVVDFTSKHSGTNSLSMNTSTSSSSSSTNTVPIPANLTITTYDYVTTNPSLLSTSPYSSQYQNDFETEEQTRGLQTLHLSAPCLLPPLNSIHSITITYSGYLPIHLTPSTNVQHAHLLMTATQSSVVYLKKISINWFLHQTIHLNTFFYKKYINDLIKLCYMQSLFNSSIKTNHNGVINHQPINHTLLNAIALNDELLQVIYTEYASQYSATATITQSLLLLFNTLPVLLMDTVLGYQQSSLHKSTSQTILIHSSTPQLYNALQIAPPPPIGSQFHAIRYTILFSSLSVLQKAITKTTYDQTNPQAVLAQLQCLDSFADIKAHVSKITPHWKPNDLISLILQVLSTYRNEISMNTSSLSGLFNIEDPFSIITTQATIQLFSILYSLYHSMTYLHTHNFMLSNQQYCNDGMLDCQCIRFNQPCIYQKHHKITPVGLFDGSPIVPSNLYTLWFTLRTLYIQNFTTGLMATQSSSSLLSQSSSSIINATTFPPHTASMGLPSQFPSQHHHDQHQYHSSSSSSSSSPSNIIPALLAMNQHEETRSPHERLTMLLYSQISMLFNTQSITSYLSSPQCTQHIASIANNPYTDTYAANMIYSLRILYRYALIDSCYGTTPIQHHNLTTLPISTIVHLLNPRNVAVYNHTMQQRVQQSGQGVTPIPPAPVMKLLKVESHISPQQQQQQVKKYQYCSICELPIINQQQEQQHGAHNINVNREICKGHMVFPNTTELYIASYIQCFITYHDLPSTPRQLFIALRQIILTLITSIQNQIKTIPPTPQQQTSLSIFLTKLHTTITTTCTSTHHLLQLVTLFKRRIYIPYSSKDRTFSQYKEPQTTSSGFSFKFKTPFSSTPSPTPPVQQHQPRQYLYTQLKYHDIIDITLESLPFESKDLAQIFLHVTGFMEHP